MRDDQWLAARLGRAVLWWDAGDDPALAAQTARERSPALVQARVPTGEVATVGPLEDAGFRVVDVMMTMTGPTVARTDDPGIEVVDAAPEDVPELLDIAEHHYGVSRFHLDPEIPDAVAGAVKRAWLQAHVDGTRGDQLLVARRDGRPIGFLACIRRADGFDLIDLVAVHSEHRSAGAGGALVAALTPAAGRIALGTQASNTVALRFYARRGFAVTASAYVLHLHT